MLNLLSVDECVDKLITEIVANSGKFQKVVENVRACGMQQPPLVLGIEALNAGFNAYIPRGKVTSYHLYIDEITLKHGFLLRGIATDYLLLSMAGERIRELATNYLDE